MKRYVIERNLPGVGALGAAELKAAAEKSNAAIAELGGRVTWEHSYVAGDKTFCVYIADSEATVMAHAQASGFPAHRVTEVKTVFEPLTAY